MKIAHWIIGPQLIGLVLLIVGYIQWFFPPKKINNWYGYRSEAAKKNQKTWDEANYYSALLTINIGYMCIIAGLLLAWFVPLEYGYVLPATIIFAGIGSAVILIVKTETHLQNIR
jgi:uncharacterized membrane protein